MADRSAVRPASGFRLVAALLVLVSLPLLWRYRPGGEADAEARDWALRHAEALAASGQPDLALRHLDAFLARQTGTPDEPRARRLRGRVKLDLLDRERVVTAAELLSVWGDLRDDSDASDLRLRAANLARDSGATGLAHEWYEKIGPEAHFDKAIARAREGRRDEALALADHAVPPEAPDRDARRAVLRARVLLELGDPKAALAEVESVRPDHLLRARVLLALGRNSDGAEAARQAAAAEREESRDEARYYEAEALRRAGSEESEAAASHVIRGRTPWRRFGHLVIGRRYLETGSPQAFLHLAEWSRSMRSPRDLAPAGLDPLALAAEWRPRVRAVTDPEEAAGWLHVLRDAAWLPPDPERTADVSNLLEVRGDPGEAGAEALKAAAFPGVPDARRLELLRRAGDLLHRSGRYLEAVAAYRRFDADRSAGGRLGLFLQASVWAHAGQIRGPGDSALDTYESYLKAVPSSDPLVPRALLNRAELLEQVGERTAALVEIERFFAWPGLPAGPRSSEWREAMRRKSDLLWDLARREESGRGELLERARAVVSEWIDRYDRDDSGADLPERAGMLVRLGQLLILDGRLEQAADEFETALERVLRAVAADAAPEAALNEIGAGLIGLGRTASAMRAYDALARRAGEAGWRIAGLAGRATALHRLGRREEAAVDRERARRLLDESSTKLRDGTSRGDALDGLVRAMEREVR